MNRPKKKKVEDPLLPKEDIIDERNLVDSEESVELSFEDKASIYWMKNKGSIITSILVIAVVITAVNGLKMFKEQAELKVQDAYATAQAEETLEDFVSAHNGKQLAGFAALKIADAAYTEEDFTKASEYYSIAVESITEPLTASRAQLGLAFSLYKTDKTEEGLSRLAQIASNTDNSEAVRNEAAYHLAIEAYTQKETQSFDNYYAQISESDLGTQWIRRLDSTTGK